MRRGFKTEAKEIARQIRGELRLNLTDTLDPWKLADWLEIPILRLLDIEEYAEWACRYFRGLDGQYSPRLPFLTATSG